jgi:hypothetical protein
MLEPTARQAREHAGTNQIIFGGIDKLLLTLGTVSYVDLQRPANNYVTDLGFRNEEARDLKTQEDFEAWKANLLIRLALQELLKARADSSSGRGWWRSLLELGFKQ